MPTKKPIKKAAAATKRTVSSVETKVKSFARNVEKEAKVRFGEETKELVWSDGKKETVHTYGWYIRKFVKDTKNRGGIPIVLSMIPRNEWKAGKVIRANENFGKWAKEVAEQEGAFFIDLNLITADKYDQMGPDKVKTFFPGDHTHTNKEGANINATSIVEGLKQLKNCPLNDYLLK